MTSICSSLHTYFQSVIDYLKFDIESSEWSVLPDLFKSKVLRNVKQIGFEIHIRRKQTEKINKLWYPLLRELADHGFKRWTFHENGQTVEQGESVVRMSNCIELYYVNTNFV